MELSGIGLSSLCMRWQSVIRDRLSFSNKIRKNIENTELERAGDLIHSIPLPIWAYTVAHLIFYHHVLLAAMITPIYAVYILQHFACSGADLFECIAFHFCTFSVKQSNT